MMAMKNRPDLAPPTHPGHKFTWTRSPKSVRSLGTAEVSDLGPFWASRLWKDSMDVGFYVQGQSERQLFVYDRRVQDSEGDVTAWVFSSESGHEIHVLND